MDVSKDHDPFEKIIHRYSSADKSENEINHTRSDKDAKANSPRKDSFDTIIGMFSSSNDDNSTQVEIHTQDTDSAMNNDESSLGVESIGYHPCKLSSRSLSSGRGRKLRPRFVGSYILQPDKNHELIDHAECGIHCPGGGICCELEHGYKEFGSYTDHTMPKSGDKIVECECSRSCPGYGRCCDHDDKMLSSLERMQLRPVDSPNIECWKMALADGSGAKRREVEEALICLSQTRTDDSIAAIEDYIPRANIRLKGLAKRAFLEWYLNADPPTEDNLARELESETSKMQLT